MQSKRGTTIIEMLVVMAVSAVAFGGITDKPVSTAGSPADVDDVDDLEVRLAGQDNGDEGACSAPDSPAKPPFLIYASASSFSFETDCVVDNAPNEQFASYTRSAVPIIDTVTFFAEPDSFTTRTDDFVLMRQVNDKRPEIVLYNVLAYPGRPFFQYYYRRNLQNGRQSTHPVPTEWLPLRHAAADHGVVSDTGATARIDLLRAIEVNYRVTDGRTGPYEQIRAFSPIIPLADLNRKQPWPSNEEPVLHRASTGSTESFLASW